MLETEFLQLSEKTFLEAEEFAQTQDDDCDITREGNVLTIEKSDGETVVINRQEAMQEIWLASRLGGYHFSYDAEGNLRSTRDKADFKTYLARAMAAI